jgi:hypothetical protein
MKMLAVYLTDHFAGAAFGVELVRRCQRNNEGTPFHEALKRLTEEIEDDRRTLRGLMRLMRVEPSIAKTAAGWGLEKIRRLKPQGRRFSYTPLARVEELEALASGILGKRSLWRALQVLTDGRLASVDFPALIDRATSQLDAVEGLHAEAVTLSFGASDSARSGDGGTP